MKILLLWGRGEDPATTGRISNLSGVYATQITKVLRDLGIEVVFGKCPPAPLELPEGPSGSERRAYSGIEFPSCDHALCVEQNAFQSRPFEFFEAVRNACSGYVGTMHDHDRGQGPEDFQFHARKSYMNPASSAYVGWASDETEFFPEQDPTALNILIDHKYFLDERHDSTETILQSVLLFARRYNSGEVARVGMKDKVIVRFLGPSGLEIIDSRIDHEFDFGNERLKFHSRVPFDEMAAWTRMTDVFVVTHRETMGLAILENAMAGATIVCKRGYAEPELLYPLKHVEYEDEIDWETAVQNLKPGESRLRALNYTWNKLVGRMLDFFEQGPVSKVPNVEYLESGGRSVFFSTGHVYQRPDEPIATEWLCRRVKHIGTSRYKKAPALCLSKYRLLSLEETCYIHRTFRKVSWPLEITFSFLVRYQPRLRLTIILFGFEQQDGLWVLVDIDREELSVNKSAPNWELRGGGIERPDNDHRWVVVRVRTNHYPRLGAIISFAPHQQAEEPDLSVEIGAVSIAEGSSAVLAQF